MLRLHRLVAFASRELDACSPFTARGHIFATDQFWRFTMEWRFNFFHANWNGRYRLLILSEILCATPVAIQEAPSYRMPAALASRFSQGTTAGLRLRLPREAQASSSVCRSGTSPASTRRVRRRRAVRQRSPYSARAHDLADDRIRRVVDRRAGFDSGAGLDREALHAPLDRAQVVDPRDDFLARITALVEGNCAELLEIQHLGHEAVLEPRRNRRDPEFDFPRARRARPAPGRSRRRGRSAHHRGRPDTQAADQPAAGICRRSPSWRCRRLTECRVARVRRPSRRRRQGVPRRRPAKSRRRTAARTCAVSRRALRHCRAAP